MIEAIRDNHGRILAVCEWLLFKDDVLHPEGDTLMVSELEINPDQRGSDVLRVMMKRIYDKNPQAQWLCYFRNYKYPGEEKRYYSRDQVGKLLGV